MKKLTKRILSVALAMVFAVCMLTNTVFAANSLIASLNTTTYLALGDSITAGYGLSDPDTESFVTLFGNEIGATTINYGVSGLTAATLAETLATGEYDTYLAMVDVVTITIGGNDLMQAFYEYLIGVCNTTYGTSYTADDIKTWFTDGTSYQTQISTVMAFLQTDAGITGATTAVSEAATTALANIQSIITKILTVNPDAVILLANQYNPYTSLAALSDYASISTMFDTAVTAFNALLAQVGAMGDNVVVVDVYSAGVATNVNILTMNFDFHPNASGHEAIAAAMVAAYETVAASEETEPEEEVAPVETGTTEATEAVSESTATTENPTTGIAISLIPMAIALAGVALSKKK
ncbi:MAG: GDSL-type esterase/lipase family protein [Oscillospiraceae bacterium]|nr:GDSL-type esterase/lipase family protein [Oscillospiraceae bacterium]